MVQSRLQSVFNRENNREPLLDTRGMAEHLGVSLRTIRAWLKARDIPHEVLPGGSKRRLRRFRASEVEAWLSSTSRNSYNTRSMGLYRYKTGKNKSEIWRYWFAVDGQRTYGTAGTADHAQAKEIYVQAYNAALEGKRTPKGRITLDRAVVGYLAWCKTENKPSTYRDKINRSHVILRHLDKVRRLSSIGAGDIEQYKVDRKNALAKHKKGAPSEATINRELSFLQGLFTWAVRMRHIAVSPFHGGAVRKYKETPTEGKYLNADQKQKLIAACSDTVRPVVIAAMSTGMRMGELRALLWRQVNIDFKVIQIINTKSKKNRVAKMGPGLVEMFKRLPKRSDFTFSHEDGRPLSMRFVEEHFERACQRAAIMGFTFHDLRDVFATDFYQQTKDIRKLQRVLGHSNLSTTERYLATLGLEDTTEVDAISDALFTETVRKSLGLRSGEVAAPQEMLENAG